ncbi:SAF domain-containing protein [Paenibacillus arenosi]|uniref:SAF domain-containing protein n=1 Tax=Paenibacillus arenosi TaxID=2774142 RepID=A0ABR9AWY1_9BACL|nr:SAF domain-containing protein [Paenibacillus arenosi]MBD8497466.1 SAF domain-containing protein [Paenibacillus arenosi]
MAAILDEGTRAEAKMVLLEQEEIIDEGGSCLIGRWSRRTKQVAIGVVVTATIMATVSGGYIIWIERNWQIEREDWMKKAQLSEQIIQGQEKEDQQQVWVLAKSKVAGSRLHASDLKQIELPKRLIPEHVLEPKDVKGSIAKIDLAANVPLIDSMVGNEGSIGRDIRWIETGVIQLPLALESNQIIDVRIRYPDGQDYVVLSHKKVHRIQDSTIWIHMSEHELLTMSSACVDAYLNGGQIYALRYVDAYVQERAIVNYPINQHVTQLIHNNPNLLKDANIVMSAQARKRLEGDLIKHSQSQIGSSVTLDSGAIATSYGNSTVLSSGGNGSGSNNSGSSSSTVSPFTGQSKVSNREAPFVGQSTSTEQGDQTEQQQQGQQSEKQPSHKQQMNNNEVGVEQNELPTKSMNGVHSNSNNMAPGANQSNTSTYKDLVEVGEYQNDSSSLSVTP